MNSRNEKWRDALISSSASIKEAIKTIQLSTIKIALVVNSQGELIGTISDGDIRRAILKNTDLLSPVNSIYNKAPFVLPENSKRELAVELMLRHKIHQVPILNQKNQPIGVYLWDETEVTPRKNLMVVMAGGEGLRMRPLTESCPKPMLKVFGKPIIEHIVNRGKASGFFDFIFSVNYMSHIIEGYFGNGYSHGVSISYIKETQALGTAGALHDLSSHSSHPILITNGDILSNIDYSALLDFHIKHSAIATMAVKSNCMQSPYGVVELDGIDIVRIKEKPTFKVYINAGIYVLNPEAFNYLERDKYCDMPTLFERLQYLSKKIIAFPIHEPWIDVGRPEDLEAANSKTI